MIFLLYACICLHWFFSYVFLIDEMNKRTNERILLPKKIIFVLVHNSEFLENLIKNIIASEWYPIRTHFDID